MPRLTARGHHVTAIVRRARERVQAICEDVRARGGDPGLLSLLEGDLARPQLALDEADLARLPSDCVVIHLGALMEMGISEANAHRVNVEGTALLRLTGQRAKAESLGFIANDRYDTASARAALAREQLSFPEIDSAFRRHLDFLVANHYGCGPAHDGALTTLANTVSLRVRLHVDRRVWCREALAGPGQIEEVASEVPP